MISADFLASDYRNSVEIQQAIARHNAKYARVIPIILRSVDWQGAPFSHLQALPTGAKPVIGREWHNQDEAFADIAQGIRKVIDELRTMQPKEHLPQSASTLFDGVWTNPQHKLLDSSTNINAPIIHSNPFLFNQVLSDPKEFYGRFRERQTLLNRTYNAASTSIVGPRRIGKTWLMHYIRLIAPQELGSKYLIGYLIDIVESWKSSPFFNVFKQITLKPFDRQEAEHFVREKGKLASLTTQECEKLLPYGQYQEAYWPISLQLAGETLVEDKMLADTYYYRPAEQAYWEEFECRLQEDYQGMMK